MLLFEDLPIGRQSHLVIPDLVGTLCSYFRMLMVDNPLFLWIRCDVIFDGKWIKPNPRNLEYVSHANGKLDLENVHP